MAGFKILAAALILALPSSPAVAQIAVTPDAPRWGDTLTITADAAASSGAARFEKSDRLYAVLSEDRQGYTGSRDRRWVEMKWDGRRFAAELTLGEGCEAGQVAIATAERRIDTFVRPFLCRRPDGTPPPGALITGLTWGGRDPSKWPADIAQDLAQGRTVPGAGWALAVAWLFE
jgi:hypothetical protein